MPEEKIYLNWSSGKDAALALYYLQQENKNVDLLLTSINENENAVSMHNVSSTLLDRQLEAISIPNQKLMMPSFPSMETYERIYNRQINSFRENGFTHAAFGDIFLEDLRQYREEQLAVLGIKALFPLWKQNSIELAEIFIAKGFRAIIICVNTSMLSEEFLGREINAAFLQELPGNVDPCGENGEYHSFCFAGPVFPHEVSFKTGSRYYKDVPDPVNEGENIRFAYLEIF